MHFYLDSHSRVSEFSGEAEKFPPVTGQAISIHIFSDVDDWPNVRRVYGVDFERTLY
jgi:hypothetical protein